MQMHRSLKTMALALAVLAGSLSIAPATAQTAYPSRPVTLVVPQAAGGTNDIVGRLVGQKLGEVMNAAVVVDNRPGAGGNIGTQLVAKAPKDGHTLLMTISSSQAINPALYKNPGFDPVKDFRPVGLIGAVPNVLLVNPAFPARTLGEFLTATRSKDASYQYASAGNGTLNHLLGEMLNEMAGTSGSTGERFAPLTANARSLPLRMCGRAEGRLAKTIGNWLPSTSLMAGATPL